jgi:DNA-binding response OmpR family regulator
MKVLIIDDYEGTAITLKRRFALMGHTADCVTDGKKALEICKNKDVEQYDWILVDLYLNGINGIDIFDELKKIGIHNRVVFITGCNNNTDIFGKAAATKQPLVIKTFDTQELVKSLELNNIDLWAKMHMAHRGIKIHQKKEN